MLTPSRVTLTPWIPGSPGSCTPFAFKSSQTKSPKEDKHGLTVTFVVAVETQPSVDVTVNVYTPVNNKLAFSITVFWVDELNPLGPVHLYDKLFVFVQSPAVSINFSPWQTVTSGAIYPNGFGLTVTFTVKTFVHLVPLALFNVTTTV